MNFYAGGTFLGSGTLNGSGVATLDVSSLAIGVHALQAHYAGDGNARTSESSQHAVVINNGGDFTAIQGVCSHEYFELDKGFLTAGTITSTNGGTVTMAADGTFVSNRQFGGSWILSVGLDFSGVFTAPRF